MQYAQKSLHTNIIVNQQSSVSLLGKENDVVGTECTHSLVAASGGGTNKAVAEDFGVCGNF